MRFRRTMHHEEQRPSLFFPRSFSVHFLLERSPPREDAPKVQFQIERCHSR